MPRPTGTQATRPVYLKLRDEIVAAILTGTFREGELLPSVRSFVYPSVSCSEIHQHSWWSRDDRSRGGRNCDGLPTS